MVTELARAEGLEGHADAVEVRARMKPPLRPDLESLAPYRAPQPEAPVRLNTNECPYPLPEAFAADLAERGPRRSRSTATPTATPPPCARPSPSTPAHPFEGVWAANGSNEVLEQLLLAYGGPGRRAALFTADLRDARPPGPGLPDRRRRACPSTRATG